jgi:hypothetical protein
MDDIKLRKAALIRLCCAFKIANKQCVNALPKSYLTIATWIEEIYIYFELTIKEEIKQVRLKILISFDGWGLKHKKISLVGVVAYFIDFKGHAVSRLLGMPELPGHSKARKSTYFPSKIPLICSTNLSRLSRSNSPFIQTI